MAKQFPPEWYAHQRARRKKEATGKTIEQRYRHASIVGDNPKREDALKRYLEKKYNTKAGWGGGKTWK